MSSDRPDDHDEPGAQHGAQHGAQPGAQHGAQRDAAGDAHPALPSAERLKAFADAVVAIAMTLLILPLVESVSDIAGEGGGAFEWFDEHLAQLVSFVLSFVMIALSWMTNHRVFAGVERVSNGLIWLMTAWMLTIVWLPVPTAMLGGMVDDAALKIVYIGSLAATYVVQLTIRWYLLRHPQLHVIEGARLLAGLLADVLVIALFGAALLIAVLVPTIGYWALLLLTLVSPIQGALLREHRHHA